MQRVGRELRFLCKVSLLEIYQEVVTDLLNPAATRLVVREDIRKGTYVDGLSEEAVSTGTSSMSHIPSIPIPCDMPLAAFEINY